MDSIGNLAMKKILYTMVFIFITFCNFLIILPILLSVWAIGYISSVLGINAYLIDVLLILAGIGSICVFIIYTLADVILIYKMHFKL